MAFIAYVFEPYLRNGVELNIRPSLPCLIQKEDLEEAKEVVRRKFKDRRDPEIERMLPGPFENWEEGGYRKIVMVQAVGDIVFLLGAEQIARPKDKHTFFV